MAVEKTLAGVSNLVKLLPTTTVLCFQALNPFFSNKGQCFTANKCLTFALIAISAISCIFFSLTDSFTTDKKFYYGVATFKKFIVINSDGHEGNEEEIDKRLRLRFSDYVHAFLSVVVFLSFGFSDPYVQDCFFSSTSAGNNTIQLLCNLPLGFGLMAGVVFLIFPNTRKGIGYSDHSEQERNRSLSSQAAVV